MPTGDPITGLPVDQELPQHNEVEIVNTLFKKNRSAFDVVLEDSKDALLVGVLVILFCLPQIDVLIGKVIPITSTSPYVLLLTKGAIAVAAFWLIKYFYLSRKQGETS